MTYRLIKLHRRFKSEVEDIRYGFHESAKLGDRKVDCGVAEYSVVRLQDAWNNLCRDFIFISTIHDTIAESGKTYHKSNLDIRKYDDMLLYLRKNWQISKTGGPGQPMRSYWRPRWFRQDESTKSGNILSINNRNFSQIINSTSNPIEQIIPLRNFSAHRDKSTREAIESKMHLANSMIWRQPSDIVRVTLGRVPDDFTIFDEWSENLVDLSNLLAVS